MYFGRFGFQTLQFDALAKSVVCRCLFGCGCVVALTSHLRVSHCNLLCLCSGCYLPSNQEISAEDYGMAKRCSTADDQIHFNAQGGLTNDV